MTSPISNQLWACRARPLALCWPSSHGRCCLQTPFSFLPSPLCCQPTLLLLSAAGAASAASGCPKLMAREQGWVSC